MRGPGGAVPCFRRHAAPPGIDAADVSAHLVQPGDMLCPSTFPPNARPVPPQSRVQQRGVAQAVVNPLLALCIAPQSNAAGAARPFRCRGPPLSHAPNVAEAGPHDHPDNRPRSTYAIEHGETRKSFLPAALRTKIGSAKKANFAKSCWHEAGRFRAG